MSHGQPATPADVRCVGGFSGGTPVAEPASEFVVDTHCPSCRRFLSVRRAVLLRERVIGAYCGQCGLVELEAVLAG